MGALITQEAEVPPWAARGDGDGYGYGYGNGYGYGDGDGNGYGYGYGDGDKAFWASAVNRFASAWPIAQQNRLTELRSEGATIAYWRSDASGRPTNGGNGDPVKPGDRQSVPGPLKSCGPQALHATLLPPRWQGARYWIVALTGEVIDEGDKLAALHREIIGECL